MNMSIFAFNFINSFSKIINKNIKDSCYSFVCSIIFFFLKWIIFIVCSLKASQKEHLILIFYTIKYPYLRNWIPARNMLKHFCCEWFFKIIFTSIYSFNQRFKICINDRWCLIKFLVLIKLQYLSVYRRHDNTTKAFRFMRFKFAVYSKQMKKTETLKITNLFFDVNSLNNRDSLLLQDNAIILCLESLKEWFGV